MSGDYPEPPTDVSTVSPAALQAELDAGEPIRLLDVRDRDDVERWQISGASVTNTQLPYAKFLQAKVRDTVGELATEIDGTGPITVVCGRGEASEFVAGLLSEAGVEARNLAGGIEAWGQLVQARELDRGALTLVQYRRPSTGCLSYLLAGDGEGIVVDPLAACVDRYVADADERGVDILAVVDTHIHADHVSGLRELAAETGARRLLSAGAIARGVTFDVETLTDGDELTVGQSTVAVRALPGHTTGMIGLTVGDVVLSGDSLFLDSVARPDLEDETSVDRLAGLLYASLTEGLSDLPDETLLAPGHYDAGDEAASDGSYTAALGDVRRRVPVYGTDESTFVERATAELPPQPANATQIVAINLGRASVTEDEVSVLERGPNNCAVDPASGR